MPIALLVPLITQVGYPLAMELVKLFESKAEVTSATMLSLHKQYGTMTAADYLAQAMASPI